MNNNIHAFIIYGTVGLLFLGLLFILMVKTLRINTPGHRIKLILLVLMIPPFGLVLHGTAVSQNCAGLYGGGTASYLFDKACRWGASASPMILAGISAILILWVARLLAGCLYVQRLKKSGVKKEHVLWQRVDKRVQELCVQTAQHVPEVVLSGRIKTAAMVAGIVRPVLVVNMSVATSLNDRELDCMLLHELNHIRNKDVLFGIWAGFLRSIMIINPMSTLLFRWYLLEREKRCDAQAIKVVGSKRFYAETLLKVWGFMLDGQPRYSAMFPGLIMGRRAMEYRIRALVGNRRETSGFTDTLKGVHIVLFILIVLGSIGIIC